jgi:hypothetical protein
MRSKGWEQYDIFMPTPAIDHVDTLPGTPDAQDGFLFNLVLLALLDLTRGELRVDPRPLWRDPALVSLKHRRGAAPETADPGGPGWPLADAADWELEYRQAVLGMLGLAETDALRDARCPVRSAAPAPVNGGSTSAGCPRESYRSVIIAPPREGGAYWPGTFDERTRYVTWPRSTTDWPGPAGDTGSTIISIRVIATDLSPSGSVEQSWDYVFERSDWGGLRLLEVRPLYVVE